MHIRSSPDRPSGELLVAVWQRGYWFYIAEDDAPSKLVFRMVKTRINMRLVEATPQACRRSRSR